MPYDVLVTGAAGHLGTALMISLPNLGFTPLGVDILPSSTTTQVGSICDAAFIAALLEEHSSIKFVLHTATLHKPHVESHEKQEFIQTNMAGTLTLLECCANLGNRIETFVFFSTTSTFGRALSPEPGQPAAWIDETVHPIPKNIYGITKVAAEDLCWLVHSQSGMPVLVLRASRFFPEQDDDDERRASLPDENLKVLEMAYRRCDLEDLVNAAVCAMARGRVLGWGKYIISAPSPFTRDPETLRRLDANPRGVFAEVAPGCEEVFAAKDWGFLKRIDRVYDSAKAIRELGWKPKYTFVKALQMIREGKEWRSEVAKKVGKKGYHAVTTGIYTIRDV